MSRKPMPALVDRRCAFCHAPFKARASDVKRGWGLYCSKTCKARHAAEKALAAGTTNETENPDV